MCHGELERPVTRSGVPRSELYKLPAAVLCLVSSSWPKERKVILIIFIFSLIAEIFLLSELRRAFGLVK